MPWQKALSRLLGEHLAREGSPARLRNPSLPPKETLFAMVNTSVSTDRYYNRVFILHLLMFTLEDMIPDSNNSRPCALGPHKQESQGDGSR